MSGIEYLVDEWSERDIILYKHILEAEADAVYEAKQIIDRYWVYFDKSNRTVIDNKKIGQDPKRKTAIIAPVIEIAPSTGRRISRLIWRTFGVKGYQKANRGAGKRVPYSRGNYEYTYNPSALLKHSVGWDAKAILEAEAKLEPIRLTLKYYQRTIVSMAAKYRRTLNLTEKREKTYGQ